MINPYDALTIPDGDLYGDIPLYGRFKLGEHTFKFDPTEHSPLDVLSMCTAETDMMPDRPDGRAVFAVGDVIVKWHDRCGQQSYENADANECAAIELVNERFPWIPIPKVHFKGKVSNLADFSKLTRSR